MKQKQKCTSCGQEYWVTMLKVYVFKKHSCPDDRTELNRSPNGDVFSCPKCKREFRKTAPVEWNSMGTRIEGSTRSFEEKAKRLEKEPNSVADIVMVPEQPMCQRCRNWQTREQQATQKRERKLAMGVPDDMKVIPDSVTNADIYKYEIFRKMQTDYQEARKAEAYEEQKKQRAAAEAERKRILEEQAKKAQLPTKEEMKPLLDLETLRIQAEIKAKDARIAELQKKKEVEEQLKKNLKEQNTKIAKLKKKLEEAKKAEQ